MRMLMIASAFLSLASAFLLYGLSSDTRLIEGRVRMSERAVETARGDIAVLRAERAHLAAPARIEPLARAQGLRPIDERQVAPAGSPATTPATSPSAGLADASAAPDSVQRD